MQNVRPAPGFDPAFLRVAAGVVINAAGEVLVALRAAHRHQGGLWEFPGGKIESGESILTALTRELWEELGIRVQQARPLLRIPYRYPDRAVLLEVWRVTRYIGTPFGREGQVWRWVAPEALSTLTFPEANLPIVTALRLPSLYLVTAPAPPQDFLFRLEQALEAEARLIQLRLPGLTEAQYVALAEPAMATCRRAGAQLLLNCSPALASRLGADGIHLAASQLTTLTSRPLSRQHWVAASCHNAEELNAAHRIGADFAVLSPVLPTTTHPEAHPLGWETFESLATNAGIPIYALGGMTPAHLPLSYAHGAQGLAVLGAIWKAPDIAAAIRACHLVKSDH
ncbi:thiamine-phosphate pyrophosphorylase [Gammaproteobacteria bacterium]